MKFENPLNGQTFAFRDIRDVLAKANEPKAADRLQGVAAETVTERVAAKIVLSELTVGELTENPTVPYEKDEVTRVNLDGLNQPTYQRFKGMTIGELREWILDHKTTGGRPGTQLPGLHRRGSGGRGQAHVRHGSGLRRSKFTTSPAATPPSASRACWPSATSQQPHRTDPEADPRSQMMEGPSPTAAATPAWASTLWKTMWRALGRIADAVYSFICRNDIPTQLVVLSHMTTQMDAIRKGAPLSRFSSPSPAQRPPTTTSA